MIFNKSGNKKNEKRILAILLMLTLMVTTLLGGAGAVFAADRVAVKVNVARIAGANRYTTATQAFAAYKAEKGSVSTVILASGSSHADALSGSYLAYKKNAPILLYGANDKSDTVSFITNNLGAGSKVYILGGTGVIPSSVEYTLKNAGMKVVRLGGSDRYETNLLILQEAGARGSDIMVSSALNYADALSGSGVKLPILLVKPDKLSYEQRSFLGQNIGKKIYILGGEGAVSKAVEKGATGLNSFGSVTRIGGTDRYETSKKIAEFFYPSSSNPKGVMLASAVNFPDGLVAGPIATAKNYPILLVTDKKYANAHDYIVANKITNCTVVGGTGVISEATAKAVMLQYTEVSTGDSDTGSGTNPGTGTDPGTSDSGNVDSGSENITGKNAAAIKEITNILQKIYNTGRIPTSTGQLKTTIDRVNFTTKVQKALKDLSPTRVAIVKYALNQALINYKQNCHQLVVRSYTNGGGIELYDGYNGYYIDPSTGARRTGTKVSTPLPGDVVVYSGHVAIYIADGYVVHGGWYGSGGSHNTILWTQYVRTNTFRFYWRIDM